MRLRLRGTLTTACFLVSVVTACEATREEATDSAADRPAVPKQETAEDTSANYEGLEKPETLEERLALRQQLAEQQAKTLQERQRVPSDPASAPSGEVPDEIVDKIISDLMSKTAANRASIEVIHAESLIWNDGSLGCPKPGQVYTQALVPGYRVILSHAGQQFDYRATEKGFIMLCEQPTLAAPGASNDSPAQ